jgi:hypothetical protein
MVKITAHNQLYVFGGYHQWRDQEKNKFEQSSYGKFNLLAPEIGI